MDRFWDKVDKSGECWEWTGAKDKDGYGLTKIRAISKNMLRAHRLSALWAGIISDLTDGHFICHSCDNPACVNPDHLWRGSPADNAEDRDSKGRGHYGEKHPMAKLTEDDVRCIKNLLLAGAQQKLIAKQFGIHASTISMIKSGQQWSHV